MYIIQVEKLILLARKAESTCRTSDPNIPVAVHEEVVSAGCRSHGEKGIKEAWIPESLRHGWIYHESNDGPDTNLLIMLHGRGDKPGRTLRNWNA